MIRTRWFWAVMLLLTLAAAVPRLLIYDFSLPYIDHPDEPNYYLAGLEWRGQYDNNDYFNGFPPVYMLMQAAGQSVLAPVFGLDTIAETTRVFRLVSVLFNLGALVLLALTARRIAGDVAGVVTGAAWALSPLVVEHGAYALPDPTVYLLAALTLWLSVEAWYVPERAHWCVWGMVAAVVAVLTKYPALPLLAAPGLVALGWVARSRQRGLRYLVGQVAVVVGFAVLFAGYLAWSDVTSGAWFNYYGPFEAASERAETPTAFNLFATAFNVNWIVNNHRAAALTVGGPLLLVVLVVGVAAYFGARRTERPTVQAGMVGVIALVVFGTCWAAAGYLRVTVGDIRHVMVAGMGMMILLGVAVAQIAALLPAQYARGATWGLGAVAVIALAVIHVPDTVTLMQDRTRPDVRVVLRQWFDDNLDAGTVLVSPENDKTFNPIWGGIPHKQWVDWQTTSEFDAKPPDTWVREDQVYYAAIPQETVTALTNTADGQQYLNQLLPLRTFDHDGRLRGPQMTFYRLWGIDEAVSVRFGDAIQLVGHDAIPDEASPGDVLSLRFYWQAETPPTANYSMFVHLVAAGTTTPTAQIDGNPAAPGRLTQQWTDPTETLISPVYELVLPPELEPGAYALLVGLYNFETGARLPVSAGGDSYTLATITIGR